MLKPHLTLHAVSVQGRFGSLRDQAESAHRAAGADLRQLRPARLTTARRARRGASRMPTTHTTPLGVELVGIL
jgi:hypothetical protein